MKVQSKNLVIGSLSIILAIFSFRIFLNFFDAPYLYNCLNIGLGPFTVIYTPSSECVALWKSTTIIGKVITLIGVVLFSALWYKLLYVVLGKLFHTN